MWEGGSQVSISLFTSPNNQSCEVGSNSIPFAVEGMDSQRRKSNLPKVSCLEIRIHIHFKAQDVKCYTFLSLKQAVSEC